MVFLLGSTEDEKLEEELVKEEQIYEDILQSTGSCKPVILNIGSSEAHYFR